VRLAKNTDQHLIDPLTAADELAKMNRVALSILQPPFSAKNTVAYLKRIRTGKPDYRNSRHTSTRGQGANGFFFLIQGCNLSLNFFATSQNQTTQSAVAFRRSGQLAYICRQMKPYVVGISGGSASGKSSFLRHLREMLPENSVCIVSQDNYYLPLHLQHADDNNVVNFDLPESIDRKGFYKDMERLMNGDIVEIQEYTFNNKERQPQTIVLTPAPVIVMEGLYIFHYEEIKRSLDLKVYIDARDDVKLQRRLLRDRTERGYPEETVLYQWHHHVMPSYQRYLRPHRDDADIIITNNINYNKGLQVLVNHLCEVINTTGHPVSAQLQSGG
jgi:uridine kinase